MYQMVHNSKIEVKYRTLKKKAQNRNNFRKYAFVSFAVLLLSYILIISYAEIVSVQTFYFSIAIAFGSAFSFLYYTTFGQINFIAILTAPIHIREHT